MILLGTRCNIFNQTKNTDYTRLLQDNNMLWTRVDSRGRFCIATHKAIRMLITSMARKLTCEKQANMTASLMKEYQPAQEGLGKAYSGKSGKISLLIF